MLDLRFNWTKIKREKKYAKLKIEPKLQKF